MRGDKKLYLVEFPADPSLRTWTMETHLPCDVGDLIFRPRSVQVGSGIVRAEITARTEAPSPYAARYKWIRVTEPARYGDAWLAARIRESYELVAAKLPKKTRQTLGLA